MRERERVLRQERRKTCLPRLTLCRKEVSAATQAAAISEGARRRSRSGSRSTSVFSRGSRAKGRSRQESSIGVGRHPPRGAHSQGLAAVGGRVGTRRETTELGSFLLPAGSVELRSPDFADEVPFDGVTELAGAAHSRGGARSSGCWRDGQSSRSFGATVQSRRALATRR